MSFKLPDASSMIGQAEPGRIPFGPQYRLPNFVAGAGEGLKEFGRSLQGFASEQKAKQDALAAAQAEAKFSIDATNLYYERSQDQDYNAAPDRFGQGASQILQNSAALIHDPTKQAEFIARNSVWANQQRIRLMEHAHTRWGQDTIIANDEMIDDLQLKALLHPEIAQDNMRKIDGIIAGEQQQRLTTPTQAEARRRRAVENFALMQGKLKADSNPQQLIEELNQWEKKQRESRPAPTPGPQSRLDVPSSPVLADRRSSFRSELESNPQLRKQVAAMAILEGAKDPVPVIESLANRYDYVNSSGSKKTVSDLLHGGFYGPINRGQLPSAMRRLDENPQLAGKIDSAINAVLAGSNTLNGATDQGLPTDPNGRWQGGRVVRGGNVFNDWGGGPGGHEGARQYREQLQQQVASGGTGALALNEEPSSDNQLAGKQYAQANTGVATDANSIPPQGQRVRTGSPFDFMHAAEIIRLREYAEQKLLTQIRIQNEADRRAEHDLKMEQEKNYSDLMADSLEGKTKTDAELADLLRAQKITPAQEKALRAEANRDDPATLLDLNSRVQRGEDIGDLVVDAQGDKRLTPKTAKMYINANRTKVENPLAKAEFERLKTIGNAHAIEQGLLTIDKGADAQKAIARWNAMQGEWIQRVMIDHDDPVKVFEDMNKRWAPVVNSADTMPRPVFATKQPANEQDLNDVAVKTYQAFQNKQIDQKTYDREVGTLNQWRTYFKSQPTPAPQEQKKSGGGKILGRTPDNQ